MININLEKAKEIHKDKIRSARYSKFQDLDVQFQRSLETGSDTSEIVAQKNLLRDATQSPEIDAASTVEQLKSAWDETLLGPSPYTQV